jgi:hypothetical protein
MSKNKKSAPQQKDAFSSQEILEQKWRLELKKNKAVQNFFSGYNSHSIDAFLDHYTREKFYWHLNPERNEADMEAEELRWINKAFDHLEMILQKKLFDAQCLWRAEKVSFKEVEICEDFIVWEHNIYNCPFIAPVNDEDLALYNEFLLQPGTEAAIEFEEEWQDYTEIKEAYHSSETACRNFPEWYDFHINRTGSGALLILPDIRGEKENFYCALNFAKKEEDQRKKEKKSEKTRDNRPFLHYSDEDFIKWFVNSFEDKKNLAFYKHYSWVHRNMDATEEVQYIIDELMKAGEPVPIEANEDWIEGLKLAYNRYECKKIAEALPMALEQYQMNIQMNIAFPETDMEHYNMIREVWLNNILNGRELNAEPRTLDF